MKYTVEIEFKNNKNCVECPLKDREDDSCALQLYKFYGSWEEQMGKCPLIEVNRNNLSSDDLIYALKHMKNGFECIKRFKKIEDIEVDKMCDEHISATIYYIDRLKKNNIVYNI